MNIEKECPKLAAWVNRCMEREAVSKTLPDPHKFYDYLLEMQKKKGQYVIIWNDVWLFSEQLRTKFPSLFHLAAAKDSLVAENWVKVGQIGCWAVPWSDQFSTAAECEEWQSLNAAIESIYVNQLEDR
ncbi:hypothetical protein M8C21_000715 [Ambrosia artemisiifolia]|uniref:Uncharacterized protein n=1 Tax=Ambrosia artemisiifolia TaxID=4212 RepID=A0AAD5GNJ9_AMBAR|nr:hypothetical protein M8C21_000715 [Ambrosia artemisiifolia]